MASKAESISLPNLRNKNRSNNNNIEERDEISPPVNDKTDQSETSDVSTPQKEKTIVSFVLDDSPNSTENTKQEQQTTSTSKSRVSILYAIVVTLIGIAFPITEALRDRWLTEWVVGAFLVYLYALSAIFLLFLLFIQLRKNYNDKRKKKMIVDSGLDNRAYEKNPGEIVVARRKSVAGLDLMDNVSHMGGSDAGHHVLPNNPSGMDGNPDLAHLYLATRRMSRVTSKGNTPWRTPARSVDPSTNPSPQLRRRAGADDTADGTEPEVDDFNMADYEEYEDEIVEYINIKSQTASLGHEGTSLYLRLGCILFGIANLVYVGMEIEYYQGGHISPDCPDYPVIWPMYFHLIFLVVQTFYLFKNTTLQAKKHKGLIRLGLMHLLATNLCVWARFLVREVMEGVHGHHFSVDEEVYGPSAPGPEDNTTSPCYDGDSLLKEASPYLFPFVLEYSLIAMATYAGMYAGLEVKLTRDLLKSVKETLLSSQNDKKDEPKKKGDEEHHDHGVFASFAKAHRGLFLGVLVLAGIVISIILFFYNLRNQDQKDTATLIYHISDITLNALLLIAVIMGLIRFFKMGFSSDRANTIDNTLLVVSFAGLFMLEIFVLISAFVSIEDQEFDDVTVMDAAAGILSVVQAILQTIFICDGLQRYAINSYQEKEKPGRGTIIFMIIVNVGMWIFKTFQAKEIILGRQEEFYGETPWRIILNISLPLLLFFRFHSSICLADMYGESFKPEEKPLTYSYIY